VFISITETQNESGEHVLDVHIGEQTVRMNHATARTVARAILRFLAGIGKRKKGQ